MKSVQILSYFWPVFFRIRSEYGKTWTRKNILQISSFSKWKKTKLGCLSVGVTLSSPVETILISDLSLVYFLLFLSIFSIAWNTKTNVFYKQHFYKQRQTEIGKTDVNAKQHSEAEPLLFKSYSHSSSTLSSKNNRTYSKK